MTKPFQYPWTQPSPIGRFVVEERNTPPATVYDVTFHPDNEKNTIVLQSGGTADAAYNFVCGVSTGIALIRTRSVRARPMTKPFRYIEELQLEDFEMLLTGGFSPKLVELDLYWHHHAPGRPDCVGEYGLSVYGMRFIEDMERFATNLTVGVYLALFWVPDSDGADWKGAVEAGVLKVVDRETSQHERTKLGELVAMVISKALHGKLQTQGSREVQPSMYPNGSMEKMSRRGDTDTGDKSR